MPANSKKLSQERFTRFAEGYVTSTTHAKGSDLDRLIAIAQPQPHWRVLDVATGGGHTALKFAQHVTHITATDMTPRMLDKAREFISGQGIHNIAFEVADAENLPFDAGSFDLVTCRIAPHHFPDAAKFVREAARVLKHGGLFLMQDQMLPEDDEVAGIADSVEKLRDPSHNHAFSRSQWFAMFEAANLSVEHSEEFIKRHDFLNWTQMQGCTPEVISVLESIVANANADVKAWMQPQDWRTPKATFVNHHIIIAGRK